MEDDKQQYLQAYETWQAHLMSLHRVLLHGERLEPPKLKALLNREARSKEHYDEARRKLLGLTD